MSKFKNSNESVSSSLMLWSDVTTQVGIKEKYEMKVWPVSGDYNEGPINFNIQEQAKSLLDDIVNGADELGDAMMQRRVCGG